MSVFPDCVFSQPEHIHDDWIIVQPSYVKEAELFPFMQRKLTSPSRIQCTDAYSKLRRFIYWSDWYLNAPKLCPKRQIDVLNTTFGAETSI